MWTPKPETPNIETQCSERRFKWQPPVFSARAIAYRQRSYKVRFNHLAGTQANLSALCCAQGTAVLVGQIARDRAMALEGLPRPSKSGSCLRGNAGGVDRHVRDCDVDDALTSVVIRASSSGGVAGLHA